MSRKYDYLFKCIFLGDNGCGKTTILHKYLSPQQRFKSVFEPDFIKRNFDVDLLKFEIEVEGLQIQLQLWNIDSSLNQNERIHFYDGANGAIVLFDLTKRESFLHVPELINDLKTKSNEIPIILAGNKCDIVQNRNVSIIEIEKLKRKFNLGYVECSGKLDIGLNSLFELLSFRILENIFEVNDKEDEFSSTKYINPPFEAYKGKESFVFVSYSHLDRVRVYPIIDHLHKEGIRIWYDEGINAGSEWRTILTKKLDNCSTFIIFISHNSMISEDVLNEVFWAFERYKKKEIKVIPIYLNNTWVPNGIKLELIRIQAIMKHKLDDNSFYKKLIDDLRENSLDSNQ
jgi:small GTP-binding protein